jgi:hypothetical protein
MLAALVASQGGKPVEHIQVTVTFPKITPDDLDEFKRLAGEALKIAADEPGVLQYDWFFNADETACVVRETFESWTPSWAISAGWVGSSDRWFSSAAASRSKCSAARQPRYSRHSRRSAPPATRTFRGSRAHPCSA